MPTCKDKSELNSKDTILSVVETGGGCRSGAPGVAYRSGNCDVLGKDDALGLDDEEVNQLVNITDQNIQGIAGNGVIATGTKLASETRVHNQFAGNLGGDCDTQDHPCKLEAPSQHI